MENDTVKEIELYGNFSRDQQFILGTREIIPPPPERSQSFPYDDMNRKNGNRTE
jgi:hypothetical protein